MLDQLIPLVRGFAFGTQIYENGGHFGPIQRPYLSLILMESGECVMRAPDASVTLRAGEAGLMASRHRFDFDYKIGISSNLIWCEGFLPENLAEDLLAGSASATTALTAEMTALAMMGLRTGHEASPDLYAARDALGVALCRMMLLSARRVSADRHIPHRILAAKQMIDEKLSDESLTLETVARAIGMTPQHLTTAFRRAMGMTPGRYLWRERANRAKQMLIHSPRPQAQIAYVCGYKSLAHFSRSMKGAFGAPPGEIRRTEGFSDVRGQKDDV